MKKRVRTLKDHVVKRGIYEDSILVVDSQVADHLIKVKAAELVTEKIEAPKEKPKKKKTSKVKKDGE